MSDPKPSSSGLDSQPPSGRYRFSGQTPLDVQEGVHPEMQNPGSGGGAAPNTPEELLKMQATPPTPNRPDKPVNGDKLTTKVKDVLALLEKLNTSAAEDKEVALSILRHLETFHDDAVDDMVKSTESERSQVAAWAVDADRLMFCRRLLESIDL
jgi:hypothetical protein